MDKLQKALILVCAGLLAGSTAIAQDYTTAREVLEANLEATGGAQAWSQVNTITRSGYRKLGMPDGERESVFTEYLQYPGYSRTEETIEGPMGRMEQLIVSTPEGRWTQSMMGKREMPSREWISSDSAKDELFLLTDERVELASVEKGMDDTGPVYVVTFSLNGESYQRKYSQFTLFLTAAEAPGNSGAKEWSMFDDYKEIDGFQIPHQWKSVASITMNRNGQTSTSSITVDTTLEKISFNEELSEDLFVN